jgi:hypothetical protein
VARSCLGRPPYSWACLYVAWFGAYRLGPHSLVSIDSFSRSTLGEPAGLWPEPSTNKLSEVVRLVAIRYIDGQSIT